MGSYNDELIAVALLGANGIRDVCLGDPESNHPLHERWHGMRHGPYSCFRPGIGCQYVSEDLRKTEAKIAGHRRAIRDHIAK